MTYPPTGPPSRPGPVPSRGNGFPPQGRHRPPGHPGESRPIAPPGPWRPQPGQWAPRPERWTPQPENHWAAQAGSLAGELEGPPPPKRKTGLIAGVLGAVVLVGGGVTALIALTGGDGKTTASTGVSSVTPGGAQPSSGGGTPSNGSYGSPGEDPASVARAVVAAINTKNIGQYANLLCVKPDQGTLDELKSDWDGDKSLRASLTGEPKVTGTRATVTVALSYHGESLTPELDLNQQGSGWCADISS